MRRTDSQEAAGSCEESIAVVVLEVRTRIQTTFQSGGDGRGTDPCTCGVGGTIYAVRAPTEDDSVLL
jgi:hypothetical protein